MADTSALPEDRDWSWSIGLESFDRFDPNAVIGSPRSLEVLAAEGVAPKELIYKPLQRFEQKGLDPEVAKMRHDFLEARRQDLLSALLTQMQQTEFGTSGDDSVLNPRLFGPSPPAYPQTVAFFKLWQSKLDRHANSDMHGQPSDANSRRNSGNHTPLPDAGRESLSCTTTPFPARMARAKSTSALSDQLHNSMSQSTLEDTLSLMRTVPRCSRADEEMARRTEELLVTQRQSELRRLTLAHATEAKSSKVKAEIALRGLEKAKSGDNKNKQLRQLREEQASKNEDDKTREQRVNRDLMFSPNGTQLLASSKCSSPTSTLKLSLPSSQEAEADDEVMLAFSDELRSSGTKSWSEKAHERYNSMRDEQEVRRNALSLQQTQDLQQRKEKVLSQSFDKNAITAQRNLEHRIRWKYTHSEVLRHQQEMADANLRAWQRTEARLSEEQERSANMGNLRMELKDLRRTQRLLSERQQRRKLKYQPLGPEHAIEA